MHCTKNNVILTGSSNERKVENVKTPTQNDQSVNAKTIQYNTLTFAQSISTSNNSIDLTLAINIDSYRRSLMGL